MIDTYGQENSSAPVKYNIELFHQLQAGQGLFDALVDGLLAIDRNGKVLFCNDIAQVLLGRGLPDYTLPDWHNRFQFKLQDRAGISPNGEIPLLRALRGESVTRQEMQLSGPDINPVWLSVTSRPIHDEHGQMEWAYLVLRDINLNKWSEERMALLERAMSYAAEGIAIIDAQADRQPIIYTNPALERITGRKEQDIITKDWRSLMGIHRDSIVKAMERQSFKDGIPFTTEIRDDRNGGVNFWYRLSITQIRDQQNTLTHYIAVLSDITAIIKTEEKLRSTNKQLEVAVKRMKESMVAAARLQKALLPTTVPKVAGVRFEWFFEPAEELSGDILNIIQLDDDHVALYLLDVSGHGIASAMLSVTVNRSLIPLKSNTSLLYEHPTPEGVYHVAPPSKVATRLAMRFPWDPEVGQFFTLVYGVLNCKTLEFAYTCAGHAPPICLTPQGAWKETKSHDLPIGIGDIHFEEHRMQLEPGSRLYFYSDGITESRNRNKGTFGKEKMLRALHESQSVPLNESFKHLNTQLKDWRGGVHCHDDISILAVEVEQPKS